MAREPDAAVEQAGPSVMRRGSLEAVTQCSGVLYLTGEIYMPSCSELARWSCWPAGSQVRLEASRMTIRKDEKTSCRLDDV